VGLLLVRNKTAAVDEVFIIYEDGRLIAHQTRRLKPGMDDEILSSMLIAIQSFVKDSFKDERATQLQRLDFGEKKILIEKGDHFFIAIVLHGERPGAAPKKLRQVIDSVQAEHGGTLTGWDGNLESLRGVKDMTAPLLGGKAVQKMEEGNRVDECAACGSPVGPDDKVCPSCGASLNGGELDDLEAVASDLSEKKD
ncbi:MAG: zinc ribbon domain-containing protein, partial [Methanomassiliicoccales archaeon]